MVSSQYSPSNHCFEEVPLVSEDIEEVVGTIEAGAEFSFSFDLHGLLVGVQQLVGGLGSDQVELVSGEAEITVEEGLEEMAVPPQPEEVEVVSVDRNLSINRRVSLSLSLSLSLLLPPSLLIRRLLCCCDRSTTPTPTLTQASF